MGRNPTSVVLLGMVAALSGCARSARELRSLLPAEVQPGWRLTHAADMHASDLPQILSAMAWQQAVVAEYRHGERRIYVRLVDMKGEDNAKEIARKWNASEGALFRRGEILVFSTAPAPAAMEAEVSAFARALQSAM